MLNAGFGGLAGDPQARGKVERPDENGVDAVDRQDIVDIIGGVDMLGLGDENDLLIGPIQAIGDAEAVPLGPSQADAPGPFGRVAGRRDNGCPGFFGPADVGEDQSVGPGVEGFGDPDGFVGRDADDTGGRVPATA